MATEIVQSVSRSNSEEVSPREDISSIAGIILSRNLVASYNGNGNPGAGKIEGDFYCAIRADIDADIKCTRRKTTSHIFSAASLAEGYSIVRCNIIYFARRSTAQIPTRVHETARCRVFFESALYILLLFNYAHATLPIRKLLTINPYFISRKRA